MSFNEKPTTAVHHESNTLNETSHQPTQKQAMKEYSDLTGQFTHPDTAVDLSGAAAMSTQVFKTGGLKKMLNEAHLNGYGEGFAEGYQIGFDAGLAVIVDKHVAAALARRKAVNQ